MSDYQVKFSLKGSDPGSDFVRAGDFVLFLQRLLACLGAVDVARNGEEAHFYRIRELHISSAAATLEETTLESKRLRRHEFLPVCRSLGEVAEQTVEDGMPPDWADLNVLQKMRELSEMPKHVRSAEMRTSGPAIKIDDNFRKGIERFLGRETTAIGTVVGTLDGVNVHAARLAYLYPGVGQPKITCSFSEGQQGMVLGALRKRVRITGNVTRRQNSIRPTRIEILDIDVLPQDLDLPLFTSIVGASLGFLGNRSSEEYLADLRSGDE